MAKSKLADIAPSVIGGVQYVGSLLGVGEKRQDRRQVEQQKKLTAVQEGANIRLAEQERQNALKMWKDTNYTAQLAEADKAGLSKVAVMGGAGGGASATTSGGSVGSAGSGTASGSADAQRASIDQAMALAQINNLNANTEKQKAETAGTGANTVGTEFINELNETYKDKIGRAKNAELDSVIINMEEKNADWELRKAINGGDFGNITTREAQNIITGYNRAKEELEIAKKENKIKKAEIIIRQFEADLAEDGIPPNSPWGVKLISDLLSAIGIGDRIKGAISGGMKGD